MSVADLTATFRLEAQELLEQLEQALLDLNHNPSDRDLIDSAFRALHTIKGSGAMFGFEAVAAFTHHVENAFDHLRGGAGSVTPALIAVALAARDHMRQLIEQPDAADAAAGEAILADLAAAVAAMGGPVSTTAAAAPVPTASDAAPGMTTWHIRMKLPADAMAMGNNPLMLLDELCELGTATVTALTDDVPPIEAIDPTGCYVGWDVLLTSGCPRSAIDDVFLFVLDDMTLEVTEVGAAEPVQAAAPVEAAVAVAPVAASPNVVDLPQRREASKDASSIRVPAERLDELMTRVGELVIAQSRLKQIASAGGDAQVSSVAEEIERLVLELRDATMGVRTVAIGTLFGRFRRLVHDLSHELGKQIELVTVGEETELDKTVIERLNDPLVHLIRNAIDHGLEAPDARVGTGKGPQGRITLSARHVGAQVLVSIRDDGHGLNQERIRARAEERGLIQPGAKLSENELYQLIFQPGFSTAAAITNLSGRGVGMDVVKQTVEALRGTIEISSVPGEGTEVTLRLPLTLAIIDGLLVRVGTSRYVIPLSAVEECVELSPEEDARSVGRSFLNIRDDLVPFLRLRELFNASQAPDPFQKVVIVSSSDMRVGLVVDQVVGQHQTVIKSLSKLHADVETFSGATILGDGTVALILDIAHLVAFGQAHEDRLKVAV